MTRSRRGRRCSAGSRCWPRARPKRRLPTPSTRICSARRSSRHARSGNGPEPMIETRRIETAPGLVFDVSMAGAAGAPLVLMLHGFCVSRYFWHNQIPALAAAGYLAVAPNQRGYSVNARPDPTDFDNYRVDRLIGDALNLVTTTGHGERRFHLVGHDWGGSLAWLIADRYPERLASLTMLSRPHPASFARAMKEDPEQPHRSRHHHELLDPGAGKRLLAENGKWVR